MQTNVATLTSIDKANDNMHPYSEDDEAAARKVEAPSLDEILSFLPPNARTMIFVDGPNTYMAARALGFDIDYRKLRNAVASRSNLLRCYYFQAAPPESNDEYFPVKPLLDFLAYNHYSVISKPIKTFQDADGSVRNKGNMDVEIAVYMSNAKYQIDFAILLSGDGDFCKLVEDSQVNGPTQVAVISTKRCVPPVANDDLRRQADYFVDLAELEPFIRHDPRNNKPQHRRVKYTKDATLPDLFSDPPDEMPETKYVA